MSGLNLGGFLFGNIDESGVLEDEFLDDVSRNKLIRYYLYLGLEESAVDSRPEGGTWLKFGPLLSRCFQG